MAISGLQGAPRLGYSMKLVGWACSGLSLMRQRCCVLGLPNQVETLEPLPHNYSCSARPT